MIKMEFRFFNKQYNIMEYFDFFDIDEGSIHICHPEHGNISFDLIGDAQTIVMQYTGLEDDSGRKIFEGSIVEYGYDGEKEGVTFIEFGRSDYPAFEMHSSPCDEYNSLQYYSSIDGYIKVIGNIYENKDLLK